MMKNNPMEVTVTNLLKEKIQRNEKRKTMKATGTFDWCLWEGLHMVELLRLPFVSQY
jgi:hypothetical protein